jgi:hypothetical protein
VAYQWATWEWRATSITSGVQEWCNASNDILTLLVNPAELRGKRYILTLPFFTYTWSNLESNIDLLSLKAFATMRAFYLSIVPSAFFWRVSQHRKQKISYKDEQEHPISDLRDAKQRAGEIRSTYPCRSHSENVQMNVVSVVVLASPPRDPIRSKRHNGRRLRALHTCSTTTSPPPRSSKARWSGRWDQQHDDMVLMVESICGQGYNQLSSSEPSWAPRQKVHIDSSFFYIYLIKLRK